MSRKQAQPAATKPGRSPKRTKPTNPTRSSPDNPSTAGEPISPAARKFAEYLARRMLPKIEKAAATPEPARDGSFSGPPNAQ